MLTKKTVTILVIVAIILAGLAIAYNVYDLGGKKVSTQTPRSSSDAGKVGVGVNPPVVEDKGAGGGP